MSLKSPKFEPLKNLYSLLFRTNLNNKEDEARYFKKNVAQSLLLLLE
jgi:hypothetical protein